jgi:hypothetical protein
VVNSVPELSLAAAAMLPSYRSPADGSR